MHWCCVNFIRKILIISNLSLHTNLWYRSWTFLTHILATVVRYPYKQAVVIKKRLGLLLIIINNCYYHHYHKIYKDFTCLSKLSLQSMLAPEKLGKSLLTINEVPRWTCTSSLELMIFIGVSILRLFWKHPLQYHLCHKAQYHLHNFRY